MHGNIYIYVIFIIIIIMIFFFFTNSCAVIINDRKCPILTSAEKIIRWNLEKNLHPKKVIELKIHRGKLDNYCFDRETPPD